MKALLIPLCALLLAAVSPAARADAIALSPWEVAMYQGSEALPWLLVVAVVGLTLLLLWRLRKKK